ncbi:TPA: hypothetical protein ACH7G7_005599, partial [Escherichia coli]
QKVRVPGNEGKHVMTATQNKPGTRSIFYPEWKRLSISGTKYSAVCKVRFARFWWKGLQIHIINKHTREVIHRAACTVSHIPQRHTVLRDINKHNIRFHFIGDSGCVMHDAMD